MLTANKMYFFFIPDFTTLASSTLLNRSDDSGYACLDLVLGVKSSFFHYQIY